MPDLPEIDPSLDAPLPEVPPDSQYVPYRTSSTSPDGQVHTVVGYGARARPPIQPPDGFGGGVGMPSLDQTYQAAFTKLPVDDAIKAVEAATRYQGLRGYQRDLQNGSNAAQAFAKWGPMLFRTAVGIPEAIDRSIPTPITPQQLIANRLNQAKFDAAQKAAADKASEAKVISAGGGLYRVPPTGQAETLIAPKVASGLSENEKAALKDSYTELNELRKLSLTLKPPELAKKQADKDAWFDNQSKMLDVKKRISKIGADTTAAKPNPAQPVSTQAPTPFKEGATVRSKKDGKLYTIVNGQPVPAKE
jgi:hypothetical protein